MNFYCCAGCLLFAEQKYGIRFQSMLPWMFTTSLFCQEASAIAVFWFCSKVASLSEGICGELEEAPLWLLVNLQAVVPGNKLFGDYAILANSFGLAHSEGILVNIVPC
jgi:hypothetical protein